MFNVHHSTVVHGLNDFINGRYDDAKFKFYTDMEQQMYPMDINEVSIKLASMLRKNLAPISKSKIVIPEQHRKSVLKRVNRIIREDDLKSKYPGPEVMFKRCLMMKVLRMLGWSYVEISDHFGLKANRSIESVLERTDNIELRLKYVQPLNEYLDQFKGLGVKF